MVACERWRLTLPDGLRHRSRHHFEAVQGLSRGHLDWRFDCSGQWPWDEVKVSGGRRAGLCLGACAVESEQQAMLTLSDKGGIEWGMDWVKSHIQYPPNLLCSMNRRWESGRRGRVRDGDVS